MRAKHFESHRAHRIGWLRASVLGANDGVVSVSSLVVGVAASGTSHSSVMITGVAGLVAGALSMAAGEYISVQSQADTENADIERERKELIEDPDTELQELTNIYISRGLSDQLAYQVAEQLTGKDALSAHGRDELGITETLMARPLQASLASAASFAVGAIIPIIAAYFTPIKLAGMVTSMATIVALFALGALAAYAGGASIWRGAMRVTFWGALAMAITAGVGRLFGASV